MIADDKLINEMLRNIPDPRMRNHLAQVANGNFPYSIYCLQPKINPETKRPYHAEGKLVGYLAHSAANPNTLTVVEEMTVGKAGQPIAGILTSRDRFDGRKGFNCACGHNSMIAPEERGVLKPRLTPSRQDLNTIANNLRESGALDRPNPGVVGEYDGFRVEANS